MRTRARAGKLAIAGAILAIAATPVAFAAANGPQASGSSVQSILKQIKAVKRTNAALLTEVVAIQARAAELEEREPVVNSLPTGPAGGDLTGSYPNPRIRANSISSADLLDGTLLGSDFGQGSITAASIVNQIGSAAIANGAIGGSNLTGSSVGSLQLSGIHTERSDRNIIGGNAQGSIAVSCPPGERLLGGGAEWQPDPSGAVPTTIFTVASVPDMANPNQWDVVGRNSSGSARSLFAVALCLKIA
jgi:hypothetical protein